MKVKVLKFTKNHGFHGNRHFHGRRPILRKMSRLWNREIGPYSLLNAVKHGHPAMVQFFKFQNYAYKSGSREPYPIPFGDICHPYVTTSYDHSLCQIWSSYLHTL